jgi:uncharacterized protein
MSKIIAWIIVVFLVLFALRLINARNARARRNQAPRGDKASAGAPMVRCAKCGVYLPRSDAVALPDGFACAEGQCAKH